MTNQTKMNASENIWNVAIVDVDGSTRKVNGPMSKEDAVKLEFALKKEGIQALVILDQ